MPIISKLKTELIQGAEQGRERNTGTRHILNWSLNKLRNLFILKTKDRNNNNFKKQEEINTS